MQNLDNHMDELFQKAAENYPLKTELGNFDDLMPFIAGETATTVNPATKGKGKTALLLLAFLITGGTIGTYLINSKSNKTTNDKVFVQDILNGLPQHKTVQQINIDEPVVDNSTTETKNILTAFENIFQKNKLNSFTKGKTFTNITQAVAVADDIEETENDRPSNNTAAPTKTIIVTANPLQTNGDNLKPETKKEIIDTPAQKKELAKTKPTDKNDKKNTNKPTFYYGITAGVEFNQVKNQNMTKAGLNGGILLGVQTNKKLSLETGVQLSQKKYYSEGKYFKPKTGTMPANMIISSLEGTSTLIEIPVSVKYNFSKKKNTLYGKAGVSSYIITKESNKYQAVVSGQQQEINSTYKNTHSYLASEIRISAGYQHTLRKKINIRIEPYIQIPLKGIGIGALPVTSTGIQLVLSRNQ